MVGRKKQLGGMRYDEEERHWRKEGRLKTVNICGRRRTDRQRERTKERRPFFCPDKKKVDILQKRTFAPRETRERTGKLHQFLHK